MDIPARSESPAIDFISCGVAPSFRFLAQNCQIDYESSIAQADHSPQRKSSVFAIIILQSETNILQPDNNNS